MVATAKRLRPMMTQQRSKIGDKNLPVWTTKAVARDIFEVSGRSYMKNLGARQKICVDNRHALNPLVR